LKVHNFLTENHNQAKFFHLCKNPFRVSRIIAAYKEKETSSTKPTYAFSGYKTYFIRLGHNLEIKGSVGQQIFESIISRFNTSKNFYASCCKSLKYNCSKIQITHAFD